MAATGPLIERVPPSIPIVEVSGRSQAFGSRAADLVLKSPALALAIRRHRPRVFLSGGNHIHLTARYALAMSGLRRSVRFGVRASNSSQRPSGRIGPSIPMADRLKFSGADFVVAVSRELSDEIRAMNPRLEVTCIPNGVDIRAIERLSTEPFHHPFLDERDRRKQPVIVSVGRISRQKGFDLLIRALALLPPAVPARAIIIGTGKPEKIDALRALAAELGVSNRVDFLGFLLNPFAAMRQADIFVSASRWEGASNALLEALACGVALVATDCPTGNREVLQFGPSGTLAPVEDPQGLADAIVRELSERRPRDAQKAAASHWDLDRCVRDWAGLLQEQYRAARGRT
jgi:glycosyltransferase involved in cell wall biosynthesis